MTRREHEQRAHQERALQSLGFTQDECDKLRRISMTLHRWAEEECNGTIQRADDGIPCRSWESPTNGKRYEQPIPDREAGALKRLEAILRARNARHFHPIVKDVLSYYHQMDPRGCALYILRPGDVPEGADPSAYYSRGVAVSS